MKNETCRRSWQGQFAGRFLGIEAIAGGFGKKNARGAPPPPILRKSSSSTVRAARAVASSDSCKPMGCEGTGGVLVAICREREEAADVGFRLEWVAGMTSACPPLPGCGSGISGGRASRSIMAGNSAISGRAAVRCAARIGQAESR